MKHNTNNNNSNQPKRIFVLPSGTLSLNDIRRSDAGIYQCVATNSEGSETLEIQLSVIEALTVQIIPVQQTVDLGKSTDLVSKPNIFTMNFHTNHSIKNIVTFINDESFIVMQLFTSVVDVYKYKWAVLVQCFYYIFFYSVDSSYSFRRN